MNTILIHLEDHTTVTLQNDGDRFTYHHGGARRILTRSQYIDLVDAALKGSFKQATAFPDGNRLEIIRKESA